MYVYCKFKNTCHYISSAADVFDVDCNAIRQKTEIGNCLSKQQNAY